MTRMKLFSGLAVCATVTALCGCGMSQVYFAAPENMKLQLLTRDGQELILPAKVDLTEGSTTNLKLTDIPSHADLVVWASIKVEPRMFSTSSGHFRDHCTIPIVFEADDFDQVMANNLVTKVVYLPDPEYQEVAIGGPGVATETLVSTRLEPGMDPVNEAKKKGKVLAIVRMGNRQR
jgi:hypothetical protein